MKLPCFSSTKLITAVDNKNFTNQIDLTKNTDFNENIVTNLEDSQNVNHVLHYMHKRGVFYD